jgi:hypothetical protein
MMKTCESMRWKGERKKEKFMGADDGWNKVVSVCVAVGTLAA